MARKKENNIQKLLTHSIRTRVTATTFENLEQLRSKSNCQTIGEVARKILSKEKILCYQKDISLEAPVLELIQIRKELNSIGVNINQITHYFNASDSSNQKLFHALKVAEEFKNVGDKVHQLMSIISELGKKWLQK